MGLKDSVFGGVKLWPGVAGFIRIKCSSGFRDEVLSAQDYFHDRGSKETILIAFREYAGAIQRSSHSIWDRDLDEIPTQQFRLRFGSLAMRGSFVNCNGVMKPA